MKNAEIYRDAFNMLCGDLIGEGVYRKVYACKLRPEFVVKVEIDSDYRPFSNVHEMRFYDMHREYKAVSKWLAPCEYLSPDGRILLQRRATIATELDVLKLPKTLPTFLTDTKFGNYGWIKGQFVCVDYAGVIDSPSVKLRKAEWW